MPTLPKHGQSIQRALPVSFAAAPAPRLPAARAPSARSLTEARRSSLTETRISPCGTTRVKSVTTPRKVGSSDGAWCLSGANGVPSSVATQLAERPLPAAFGKLWLADEGIIKV